jgi:hypothetical protein
MIVSSHAAAEFSWEESEDQVTMRGPGLRIVFRRVGKLWTHDVLVPSDDWTELARAVETDLKRADAGCVVSPAYDEIQRHNNGAPLGLDLLTTGRLFRHHFSAAFRLGVDSELPHATVLDVDIADRCRAPVAILAATYTVKLDASSLADANRRSVTWDRVGRGNGRLELTALAPSTLVLAEAGRSAMRVQVLAAIEPGGFTHRFRYRWRWATNSGLTR